MRDVSDEVTEKIKTRFFYSTTFYSKIVPFMRKCGNVLYRQAGRRWQCSACPLDIG